MDIKGYHVEIYIYPRQEDGMMHLNSVKRILLNSGG